MSKERVLLPNRAWLDRNQAEFRYVYGQIPKNVYKSIARYWNKRHILFSRFDEGILMNEELWYSVTPEAMAIFTAKFIKACDPTINSVLDVFCGGGGNLIQFARYFEHAYGVEFNEMNLYCAEKNCDVYGVGDKVNLKLGSWTDLIGSKYYKDLHGKIDFIFSSPPWGGPSYKELKVYNLETDLQPMPLKELLESFFTITHNVGLFLPKNSDWDQLSEVTRELLGEEAKCRVMFVYDQDRCKGILAFWGEKFQNMEYDYTQELEEMQYYYMSEKRRQQDAIAASLPTPMEYKPISGRYPDRDDDDKKVQRYATGDYSEDFYDEKDPEEEQYQLLPAAWFDPTAQRWYAMDILTNQTMYVSEGTEAPEGFDVSHVWVEGDQNFEEGMYDEPQDEVDIYDEQPERKKRHIEHTLEVLEEIPEEEVSEDQRDEDVIHQDQEEESQTASQVEEDLEQDAEMSDGSNSNEAEDVVVEDEEVDPEDQEVSDEDNDESVEDQDQEDNDEEVSDEDESEDDDEDVSDEDGPPEESSSKDPANLIA